MKKVGILIGILVILTLGVVFRRINPVQLGQSEQLDQSESNVELGQDQSTYSQPTVLHNRSMAKLSFTDQTNYVPATGILNEMAFPTFPTDSEEYQYFVNNIFHDPINVPLSTFSIDVDTASYSNLRRFIMNGQLPPKDAVRIEEMINYFTYDYPQPTGDIPFSITTEIAVCPWNSDNYLAMIGLQGEKFDLQETPPNNLVFLLDVSGSMNSPDKLPLLKSGFKLLVQELREEDRVSIVVYAGAAGVVLEPTSGDNKDQILTALEDLQAGGSTAGGAGIQLAYDLAKENFLENGNNRVILATDGDFNVGVSDERGLTELIEQKREEGIFLSVLGFGTGNIKDSKMEILADKGNGNYAYIDSLLEAKKVLVSEMGSTLLTIAKDVKIQVEFNPGKVKAYKLIGYENRVMNNEDFADDRKDAGELGAGHTVTAFYEIIPADLADERQNMLKYQEVTTKDSDEWMSVNLRYKEPGESESQLITDIVIGNQIKDRGSEDFLFASSVAELGMLLRDEEFAGQGSYQNLIHRAKQSKGLDEEGYRAEFIKLAEMVEALNKVQVYRGD